MDVAALAHGCTEFVVDLYRTVVKVEQSKNAVLSPLSISFALAMVAAGAKGPTLDQIAACIQLPPGELMHKYCLHLKDVVMADIHKEGCQLALANGVWVEESIQLRPTFRKLLKESYGSEAASVDFRTKANEVLEDVNTWANDKTNGKIQNLLPPGSVDARSKLILANAIYFKGAWELPFDEFNTSETDFFLLDGKSIKVRMMQEYGKQYVKIYPTFKALRLPYSAGEDSRRFSMYILLPHEKNGLLELEKNLNAKTLLNDLDDMTHKVAVRPFKLPKFKISSGFNVLQALKTLGLVLPFDQKADLTNMVDSLTPFCISDVFHKAFVEVNEQGTEAAAATAIVIMEKCALEFEEPIEFVADHPFLFLIKEESTNTIIFTGRVTDPSVD